MPQLFSSGVGCIFCGQAFVNGERFLAKERVEVGPFWRSLSVANFVRLTERSR